MKQIRLILMILTMAAASPAMGQVWTLEVMNLPTDTSIVRCYDSKAFVYNYSWGNKGFLLLDGNTTSVIRMTYDVDSVADMKIEGNTVYFCGRMYNGSADVGFVGCFDITSYPNAYATVYYYIFPILTPNLDSTGVDTTGTTVDGRKVEELRPTAYTADIVPFSMRKTLEGCVLIEENSLPFTVIHVTHGRGSVCQKKAYI